MDEFFSFQNDSSFYELQNEAKTQSEAETNDDNILDESTTDLAEFFVPENTAIDYRIIDFEESTTINLDDFFVLENTSIDDGIIESIYLSNVE